MNPRTGLRRVPSEGVNLAVREHSARGPGKQTMILVHGYPNQQDMWDQVVAELDKERLHIVTYDVRGAGDSTAPAGRIGYRCELLVEDLVAVVEATVGLRDPFHLVGHDWGSVQLWDVVARERGDSRLDGRVASYTSISGPSLDHVAHLTRHREGRQLEMLNQAVHWWYVYGFHLPVLPELFWTVASAASARSRRSPQRSLWGPELARNARNGLNLYRANVGRRMRRPGRLHVDVPVLVVHPTRDRFLTEVTLQDLEHACSDLTVTRLDAGHWVPVTRAAEIARMVTEHVQNHAR